MIHIKSVRELSVILGAIALLSAPWAGNAAESKNGKPANVTEQKIQADLEAGENWLLYGRDRNAQHHSPLDSINAETVDGLGLTWAADVASPFGLVAEPIVVDGVIYLSGALSRVFAIDARSGATIWRFDPKIDLAASAGTSWSARINRGVAVWNGRVYVGTGDCRLWAIDAKTGEKVWDARVCDSSEGRGGGITGAPRVGDGKVFMGYFGAEWFLRGSIAAFDANTGEELWRFWTVPGDPAKRPPENAAMELAAQTWSDGWAKLGGGVVYDAITYDPVTKLVYFGTASAQPMNARLREPKGLDNLFTNSIMAVHADTGEYAWHYQTTPFDAWDYDTTWHLMVAELPFKGKTRRVVMQAPKNGFFYVLDAQSGDLLAADPITRVTWASHVDLATGRPVEIPEARWPDTEPGGAKVLVGPSVTGAHSWPAMSYSPQTGLVYIPVSDLPGYYATGPDGTGWYEPFGLTPGEPVPAGVPELPGRLLAWDPVRRKPVWSVRQELDHNGGILSTAGGLVFQGTTSGEFVAYSADAGKELWRFETGSSTQAAPVAFSVDGEQMVILPVGLGSGISLVSADRMATSRSRGPTRLLAFKLGGNVTLPANEPVVMPMPPEQTANAAEIKKGAKLWKTKYCGECHGYYVMGIGRRELDGAVPDLRYAPESVHAEWHGVVMGGNRRNQGMLPADVTLEESNALRAYVVEQAWKEFEKQRARDAGDGG